MSLFAVLAAAQIPQVGTIDFYGNNRIPASKLLQALGVSEGDRLTKPRGDLEEAVEQVGGVLRAHVEAQCCDAGKAILYVGIEEKGSPRLELRQEPTLDLELPPDITEAYTEYLETFSRAEDKGEDFRQGHILADDLNTRVIQNRFIALADIHVAKLQNILRNAEDAGQRAVAATVLGYSPRKRFVVDDLQYAMRDPDSSVRLNAMRSLTAMAVLARSDPQLGIRVAPTWFVQMLYSLEWKDRVQAAQSLAALTDDRNESTLAQIRERGLPPLIQMAGWKSLTHALPAYMVLGRAVGFDEKKILELWALGRRSEVLGRAQQLLK